MKQKIKKEFLNKKVAFNNSAKPLKHRKDIDVLFKIATDSGDSSLLNLFEDISEKPQKIK